MAKIPFSVFENFVPPAQAAGSLAADFEAQTAGLGALQKRQVLDLVLPKWQAQYGAEVTGLAAQRLNIQKPERSLGEMFSDWGNIAAAGVDAAQQPFLDFFDPASAAAKANRLERQGHLDKLSEQTRFELYENQRREAERKARGESGIGAFLSNLRNSPMAEGVNAASSMLPTLGIGAASLAAAPATGGGSLALGGAALGLVGGIQGVGGARGDIYGRVQAADDAYLQANSADYRALRAQGLSEQAAKDAIGSRVDGHLPELAVSGLSGAVLNRMGLGSPATSALGRVGREAFTEAAEEAIQQGAANYGFSKIDPNQRLTEDLDLAAFQGGLLGAGGGAAMGGVQAAFAPQSETGADKADALIHNHFNTAEPVLGLPAAEEVRGLPTPQAVAFGEAVREGLARLSARQLGETRADWQQRINEQTPKLAEFEARIKADFENGRLPELNGNSEYETWARSVRDGVFNRADGGAAGYARQKTDLPTPQKAAEYARQKTGAGAEVEVMGHYQPVRWQLREAADLSASIDKADNQFRDRNRAAGERQINAMAAALDYRKLGDAPVMDYGAPTLAKDGRTIIGGNGRVAAMKQAYANGAAETYRQALTEDAGRYGFSAADVAAFDAPVLVRVLQDDVDIQKAAVASNEGGGLAMSALEQAKADALRLPPLDAFAFGDNGEVNTAANRAAVAGFVGAFPQNQQAALQDESGLLSQQGLGRLKNALLYRAYGDSPALQRLIEATDTESRNVGNALMRAAPAVAEGRADMAAGAVHDLDMAEDLLMAADLIEQIRAEGGSVGDWLKQMRLTDDVTPLARRLLAYIDANIRSVKKIHQVIAGYYDAVRALGSPMQADMFGETALPSGEEILERVIRETGNETNNKTNNAPTAGTSPGAADYESEKQPADGAGNGSGLEQSGRAEVGGQALPVFGQRAGLFDLPPVAVTGIDTAALPDGFKDMKRLADKLLRDLQQSPAGTLHNDDMGWDLRISRIDRKKMGDNTNLSHETSQAAAGVRDLVKHAVLAETHADDKHANENVQAVHRLYAPADIGGKLYRVKLTAKDYRLNDGGKQKNLHAIEAVEIENAPMGTFPASGMGKQGQPTSGRSISVTDLLRGAKRNDGADFSADGKQADMMSRSPKKDVEANVRRGRAAMNRALLNKTTVHRAMYRSDIGWVDFIWGSTGRVRPNGKTKGAMGISHIFDSRMRKDGMSEADVVRMLTETVPEVIARGETSVRVELGKSVALNIRHLGHHVSLKKQKGSNAWMLTAFELHEDADGKGYDNTAPTAADPTLSRVGKGASYAASDSKQAADTALPDTQAHSRRGRGLGAENGDNVRLYQDDVNLNAIRAKLSEVLGERADFVDVVSVRESMPQRAQALIGGGYEGWFDPKTRRVTLIAENLPPQRAVWAAWHELGHRGFAVAGFADYRAVLREAGRNRFVGELAGKIMAQRAAGDTVGDAAGRSRAAAVEEALVELYAAQRTGNWAHLESRYGMAVPRGMRRDGRHWLARVAEKLRAWLQGVFGTRALSDGEVLDLLAEIHGAGNGAAASGSLKFGRAAADNETVIEQAGKRLYRIADAIRNGAKYISNEPVDFGRTPLVLERLGVPQLPMRMLEPKKLFQVSGNRNDRDHNLSADVLAELPGKMQSPLAVFDSATEAGAKVLVVELKDGDGNPIVAAVHIHKRQGFNQVNKIASVYGKSNAAKQFAKWTDDGLLRYLDNTKDHSVLTSFGLQSPTEKSMNGLLDNVLLSDDTVNNQSDNEELRYSRGTTVQEVADFARTGKINGGLGLLEALRLKRKGEYAAEKKANAAQLGDWLLERFADNRLPAVRWIEGLPIGEMAQERLKQAMYRAEGMRDFENEKIAREFIAPMNREIGRLFKKYGGRYSQLEIKKFVGYWLSANYAPAANARLLARKKQELKEAKAAFESDGSDNNRAALDKAQAALREMEDAVAGRIKDAPVAGGYSNPAAAAIKADLERHLTAAELRTVARFVWGALRAKLELDLKGGRISQAQFDEYAANEEYVPLTGDPINLLADDSDAVAGGSGINQSKDKAMRGRVSAAEDGLDAAFRALNKATALYGWQAFKENLNKVYEQALNGAAAKGLSRADAAAAVERDWGIRREALKGTTRPSDNVVVYAKGGEYWQFRLPEAVTRALQNDNMEDLNPLLKMAAVPTRLFARGVTQFVPTFAPINAWRDMWEKSEMIRVAKGFGADGKPLDMDKAARAAWANFFRADGWKQTFAAAWQNRFEGELGAELKHFLELGGVSTQGRMLSKTESDLLAQVRQTSGVGRRALDKAVRSVESYNEMFDLMPSFALYRALREQGADAEQAVGLALDTTNFRKRGSWMSVPRALWAFSQPTVTGGVNLGRYLKTAKGRRRFAAHLALGMVLYSALRAMDDEDEGGNRLDQMGEITRFIPIKVGEGRYIKIPVGFGLPQLAWNMAVNAVRAAEGDIGAGEAVGNMAAHWARSVVPVSPAEIPVTAYPGAKAVLTLTPTVLQPIVQNVLNRNAFGAPLVGFTSDKKLKAEQGRASTAPEWKDAALWLQRHTGWDIAPEQVRNLVMGYAVSVLRDGINIFVENPNSEALGRVPKTPFINQLYGAGNEFALQGRFYQAQDEAGELFREYESRRKQGDADDWLTDERRAKIRWFERSERMMRGGGRRRGEDAAQAAENARRRLEHMRPLLRDWRNLEGRYSG